MIPNLTIAYITMRSIPRVDMFLRSLRDQGGFRSGISVVIVDYHGATKRDLDLMTGPASVPVSAENPDAFIRMVPPKPCVWHGPHRLTKEDWFDASSPRNTALCYARDGWIAYVDDLSVLVPTWLESVEQAMRDNYIALGAYKKVKKLCMDEDGNVQYESFPAGMDSRWNYGSDTGPVPANGGMMFGCSVAMPVEALLTINGWPEDLCGALGSEDYCCGLALENAGYRFMYDRRMLTLESEEDHHTGPVFRKEDWHFEDGEVAVGGNGGDDKSHAALNIAKQSKYFPNSFGEGGIRELRRKILAGEPFPIPTSPDRDWYTKKLLSEL
jgi:hypothetical protein